MQIHIIISHHPNHFPAWQCQIVAWSFLFWHHPFLPVSFFWFSFLTFHQFNRFLYFVPFYFVFQIKSFFLFSYFVHFVLRDFLHDVHQMLLCLDRHQILFCFFLRNDLRVLSFLVGSLRLIELVFSFSRVLSLFLLWKILIIKLILISFVIIIH